MLLPAFAGPGFCWSCCDVGGGGGRVLLADVFWLSVKGSSMLSIVQECRGGLLSRHRAYEGEASKVVSCLAHNEGAVFYLYFRPSDTVTTPLSAHPPLSGCIAERVLEICLLGSVLT